MSNNQICLNYYTNVVPYLPSDVNQQNRVIFLVYAVILYSFALVSLLVFIITKNKVVYSRQKSTFGTITLTFGLLIATTASVFREYVGRDNFSCVALAWMFHLPILFFASQPIGVMYYYIYKLRKERTKTQAIKRLFSEDIEAQSQSSFDVSPTQLFTKQKRTTASLCSEIADFLFVWRYSKDGKIIVASNDDIDQSSKANKKPVDETSITPHQQHHHQHHPTSTSGDEIIHNHKKSKMRAIIEDVGVPLMMMTAFGFVYPIAIALRVHLDPLYNSDCLGCRLTYVDILIRMACGGVYLPLAVIGLYAMRNEDDPLRVFKEVKVALMWGGISILSWTPSIIYSFQGYNDRAIINSIEMIGFTGVVYSYVLSGPITAAYDSYKQNGKVSTGTKSAIILSATDTAGKQYSKKNLPPPSALDLNRILEEPKARNAFLEHSINEISSENVVFVFKLRAWKSMWDKERSDKVTKIAVQLFKEYISKDSKNPINIPFKIYSNIVQN